MKLELSKISVKGWFVLMCSGLLILLYPSGSNFYNSWLQRNAISGYSQAVSVLDAREVQHVKQEAILYNKTLMENGQRWFFSQEEKKAYLDTLALNDSQVMGYLDIESIGVHLPIYHGTSADSLQKGVGHMQGSSLPIGGEDTHSVITGHTGLPSAELLSNLRKVKKGEYFKIRVLDEELYYKIDKIEVVDPSSMEKLSLLPGKDLVTLMTCTPYGINSHRLLVRGHRVDKPLTDGQVTGDSGTQLWILAILIVPMALLAAGAFYYFRYTPQGQQRLAMILLYIQKRKQGKGDLKIEKKKKN